MLITQANDYAARSLVFLARQPKNKAIHTKYIAKKLRIPYGCLAKIFQKLIKHNIIVSFKGRNGGVMLAGNADKKNLKEIFQAVDGAPILRGCVYDSKACFLSNNCIVNTLLAKIQGYMNHEFEKVTVSDLVGSQKLKAKGSRQWAVDSGRWIEGTIVVSSKAGGPSGPPAQDRDSGFPSAVHCPLLTPRSALVP